MDPWVSRHKTSTTCSSPLITALPSGVAAPPVPRLALSFAIRSTAPAVGSARDTTVSVVLRCPRRSEGVFDARRLVRSASLADWVSVASN